MIQTESTVVVNAYSFLIFVLLTYSVIQTDAISFLSAETPPQRHHGNTNDYARYDNPSIQRRDALDRVARLSLLVAASFKTMPPTTCYALTPDEAQQNYDSYASSYDQIDGGPASELLGIDIARKGIIQQARGKVLEVGVGTGLNLQYYNGNQITSLDVVDISDGMLREAMNKISQLSNLRGVPINFIKADMTSQLVQRFGLESYDTVIDTFSMCVLGDQGTQLCLDQLSRVVRCNGGQLLLLENSRSSNPLLGIYQDATADVAAMAGGRGCVYNQDISQLLRSNNRLRIVEETEFATGLFRFFRCVRTI